MARPLVCRFYDDAKTGAQQRTARGNAPKRLSSYDSGALYSVAKPGRRGPTLGFTLPRNAVVQALALLVFFALVIVPALEVPGARSSLGRILPAARASRSGAPLRFSVPADQVKPGVSLVAVCMGRPETLKQTAKSWLNVKDVKEIILVDWSSPVPLEPIVRSIPGGERVRVIRVDGEETWVLSRAYNLAVRAASYANVIRTDCDYAVGENFVEAHVKLLDNENHAKAAQVDAKHHGFYYSGNYAIARTENEVHLNGAVFIRRADFLAVGGYDERIQTYGWDDEDLYSRLGDYGLHKRNVSYDHVSHVKHGNGGRAQAGVKFVGVEIDLNQLLVSKLPKWNARMPASVYRTSTAQPATSNSLTISANWTPKSLKTLSPPEEYTKAWDLAIGRRLHDSYSVPWDIIAALTVEHKELLLRRLMGRTENRERAARLALDAAGKANEMVDINKIAVPRIFLCHCMHGLGNRLRALASCMSFAKETARELVIVWEKDSHIEASFDDLYKSPMVVVNKMPVQWPFEGIEKWDAAWSSFKFFNYMEMEKRGAVKGQKIANYPFKHMYYKGAYIIEPVNSELTNWDKDNANLRTLEPVKIVTDYLATLGARGLGGDNIIGMHIRNRTLARDIKNVNFVSEYGDSATATMNMWRQKSGVQSFIGEMQRLIKEKPSVKFFIATDTVEVMGQLIDAFGKDRILSVERTCDERNGACVRFALVDMYALSKCKALYGSNWSSFTEAAERLGGLKAKLAGVDFAK